MTTISSVVNNRDCSQWLLKLPVFGDKSEFTMCCSLTSATEDSKASNPVYVGDVLCCLNKVSVTTKRSRKWNSQTAKGDGERLLYRGFSMFYFNKHLEIQLTFIRQLKYILSTRALNLQFLPSLFTFLSIYQGRSNGIPNSSAAKSCTSSVQMSEYTYIATM